MGNRFFDLGNFAENHQLSAEQEQEFLQAYFGRQEPILLQRLRAMRQGFGLREATWGFRPIRDFALGLQLPAIRRAASAAILPRLGLLERRPPVRDRPGLLCRPPRSKVDLGARLAADREPTQGEYLEYTSHAADFLA